MKRGIASIDRPGCWFEWSMLGGSERRRARAFTITRLDVSRLACDTSSSIIRLTATARALFPDMPIIHACQPRSLRSRLLPDIVSRDQTHCIRCHSLLLLPEGEETDTRDLDDLESDTGNISLCLSSSTETRDKNFIVLVGLILVLVIQQQRG
jgi:hypothetical protein